MPGSGSPYRRHVFVAPRWLYAGSLRTDVLVDCDFSFPRRLVIGNLMRSFPLARISTYDVYAV